MKLTLEKGSTLADQLNQAQRALAAVSETPRLDAEILFAHALGTTRAHLLARLREPIEVSGVRPLLDRRLAYEPLAHILGQWDFFGLEFAVEPPIFVPRPDTEHLVEAVLDAVTGRGARILDIGTGCGCVAVSVAVHAPHAQLVATDISPKALELAQANAVRHGAHRRITFKRGDLFEALDDGAPFDVICSNPPYVEEAAWTELSPVIRLHEDPRAVLGGKDGLELIRRLICEAYAYLKPGGLLAFEMGMGQYPAVADLLTENNYKGVQCRHDLAGVPRVAIARKPRIWAWPGTDPSKPDQ